MSERLTLSSPSQVAAAVPALLGFHPHDSLVVLWLEPPRLALACLLRLDLTTREAEMSRQLLDTASRLDTPSAIALVYAESLATWIDSPEETAVDAAMHSLQEAGVELKDLLLVTHGRWWSLMCTDPGCCRPEGTPIPAETSVLEAQRVHHGLPAVAESREDVAAGYALRTPLPQHLVSRAQERLNGPVPARCVRACLLLAQGLQSPRKAAELLVVVQDVHVRDWLLADLARHLDRTRVDALVATALQSPEELRPRACGLAAAVLAMAADSPVGVWALIDHAADDTLASLMAQAMSAAVPPSELRDIFTQAGDQLAARMGHPDCQAA